MKINLLISSNSTLSGFLNIDPFADSLSEDKVNGDITKLDKHVDDGECEEIRAINVLEYYDNNEEIVSHWVSKLTHEGIITIGFTDLEEVAKGISSGSLNLEEANILIHGQKKEDWQNIQRHFTVSYMTKLLESFGLKVINKRIDNYSGIVKAKRI